VYLEWAEIVYSSLAKHILLNPKYANLLRHLLTVKQTSSEVVTVGKLSSNRWNNAIGSWLMMLSCDWSVSQSDFLVMTSTVFVGVTPVAIVCLYYGYGDRLEAKREYYQNCSVLDCVTQCSLSAAHLCE